VPLLDGFAGDTALSRCATEPHKIGASPCQCAGAQAVALFGTVEYDPEYDYKRVRARS
jgi:hypothetical protein